MLRIYTLINGEQIIGKSLPPGNSDITIEDPFYIIDSHDEHGNSGMSLINVCTFSKEQCITISSSHVVFSFEANELMVRYYEKLLAAQNRGSMAKMIDDAIKEMDDMDEKMRSIISNRLVGGSTVN